MKTNLEHHVVSLELAKQLKNAGYPQENHLVYWVKVRADKWVVGYMGEFIKPSEYDIAAPLASEIGEQLKVNGINFTSGPTMGFDKPQDQFNCYARNRFDIDAGILKVEHSEHGQTEADARAKMWLYLKKDGLL